jgi:hypothetical protein
MSIDLSNIHSAELQEELERRKKMKGVRCPDAIEPADIDWSRVIKLADEAAELENVKNEDNDLSNYIFEEVMIARYGPNFFTGYFNKVRS